MFPSRLFSVDPSLTCSGWAIFNIERGDLLAVGKVRALGPMLAMGERLRDLQAKIHQIFDSVALGAGDVLVCEAPTTMRDPRAAFKVEQVRGMFESVARDRQVPVPGRINPRSVHAEVMGLSGPQLGRETVKEVAVHTVGRMYGPSLQKMNFDPDPKNLKRHQDIVDAILVGCLGISWIRSAHDARVSLDHFFDRGLQGRQFYRAARGR